MTATNTVTQLDSRVILVRLRISAPTFNKRDKKVTNHVASHYHTGGNPGSFNKKLVVSSQLKYFRSLEQQARTDHQTLTVPYSDTGYRILPAELFESYRNTMSEWKHSLMAQAEKFLNEDYAQIRDSEARRLGDLFDPNDYPHVDEVRKKFDVEVSFTPMPSSGSGWPQLLANYEDELRQSYKHETEQAVDEAMRDVWQRVESVVNHLYDRLANEKNFRYNTLAAVYEMVELLPKLNITNDPEMDRITQDMRLSLCQHNTDTLRHDSNVRRQVAHDAGDLLDRIRQHT